MRAEEAREIRDTAQRSSVQLFVVESEELLKLILANVWLRCLQFRRKQFFQRRRSVSLPQRAGKREISGRNPQNSKRRNRVLSRE
jgi:hypothetical protein